MTRNGFVHFTQECETQTPPEGTGFLLTLFLRSKQMLAVYRGVAYDTDRKLTKEADYKKVTETYRGIQHTETVKVEVSK